METITDNDRLSVTVDKIIKIHTILPCPQANYYYNGIGIIDETKLKRFLGDKISNVVGWYRFRNMKTVKLTLRDNLLHKQLMHFFAPPTELFIYSLLSSDNSNISTHVLKQSFLQYDNVEFKPVNFNILNLSNATFSYKIPQEQSKIFNKVISSIKTNNGSCTAEDIHQAVQLHIEELVRDLAEEESNMFNLEQEVKILQEELKIKRSANECIGGIEECLAINGELMCGLKSSFSNYNLDSAPLSNEETIENDNDERKSYSDMLKQKKRK